MKNLIILFSCLLIACKSENKAIEPTEFIQWFKKNKVEFVRTKTIGNYQFQLEILPLEFKLISQFDNIESVNTKIIKEDYLNNKNKLFCQLKISPIKNDKTMLETGISTPEEYGARMNYFSSHAQKDMFIIQGKDTLNCLSYHFENTFGLEKSNKINLEFERKNNVGDIEFVFDEKSLNTGIIKFTIPYNTLKNTPQLKID